MLEHLKPKKLTTWYDTAFKMLTTQGHMVTGSSIIIAGGCLRDMYLDREDDIKDIDVFTSIPPKQAFYEYAILADEGKEYDKLRDWRFVCQYTQEIEGGLDMNFIHFSPAGRSMEFNTENLLAQFDFTNCQIGFDGDDLHFTPAFLQDCAAKKLRQLGRQGSGHEKRMREKFADWEFIPVPKDEDSWDL